MENLSEKIKKEFVSYVAAHHHAPPSVLSFMREMDAEEKDFYEHYSSFAALEVDIWKDIATTAVEKMKAEPVYADYTAREKMLSFYYTLVEVLKNNRSFATYSLQRKSEGICITPAVLKEFKVVADEVTEEIVAEGIDTSEILARPFISDRYGKALWLQTFGIVRFWLKDISKSFEKTDELIEKSVHFSFDLMAKTPLDTAFDLGKFLFQNR